MSKRNIQRGGKESINLQDCEKVQIGLSYSDTKALFIDLFESNFPKFRAIAREEALSNIESLSIKLTERLLSSNLKDSQFLEKPDFYYNLYRAIEVSARTEDEDLQDMLAELLVKRISFNEDDTRRIILNESIQIMDKVSSNQLKMLSFSFFTFNYYVKLNFQTWEGFNNYVSEYIKPFMDYEYRDIDIQHLDYCGCISTDYGFGVPSFTQILKNRIPALYPDLSAHKNEQDYIDSVTKNNLQNCSAFFDMMRNTNLWGIEPTSVGLMLIGVNFEVQKGYKIPKINEYFE